MSDLVLDFLNNILAENIVFISFLGVLLIFSEAQTLRKSFKKGFKFTLGLLLSIFLGWIVISWVPEGEIFQLWVYWFSSLTGIFVLYNWGELQGEWLGVPKFLIALAPFVGSQWLIQEQGIEYFNQIYLILGTGIGFYLAFIFTAGVREQIKISEIPDLIKEKPLLLVSLSFFALALIGFTFI